jgi:phosphatidylglycerol:prolipoprotein diacylglycerol transferase
MLYVLTNSGAFHSLADVLALRRGGLVAYGGFLGGLLGAWIFLRHQRLPLLPWADVAMPALASGLCLTRIGCYLFGCDFGRPLSEHAPRWLARLGTFPRWDEGLVGGVSGSPAWTQHVAVHGLSPDAETSLPVHATQLYEALVGLALVGLALFRLPRRSFRGEVFLTCAFAYGLLRFGIEVLRDDAERGVWGPRLAAHVYVPLMLLVFAAAYNYGPARSVAPALVKRASQVISLLPALVAWLALRPTHAQKGELVQLSTSQWIALATAIAIAAAWSGVLSRTAPEPGMRAQSSI